jgi:hypothetical protein
MSGIDPAVASALNSRLDMLLNAISGTSDATAARAADAASSTQWANAQPAKAPAPPGAPPSSTQTELSETAVALNVISRTGGDEAPPVVGRQPLWSTPPEAAAASRASATAAVAQPVLDGLASSLAMALEQALDTSGLFYESHLVQWLSGQRSSALLGQEPQARLPHADSEEGWPFDPEQADQNASNAPPPFTGRPAPGSQNAAATMTGDEMVDVEIVEVDGTPDQTSGGKANQAQAGSPDDGLPPDGADFDGPGTALLAMASRNAPAGAAPNTAAGTALTNPNTQASAQGSSTTTQGNSAAFSTSANAAYAAQAANSAFGSMSSPAAAASHALAAQLGQPAADNAPPLSSLPIHPDALPIVRQQLELLQSPEPQFRWSGEAWPNSKMYWELDWDPDDTRAPHQRIWRTRISLELPTLGFVDAELTLSGHQLGARITADGQSIGTLKEGTSDFMRALASAGLDLQQLAIRDAEGKLPAQSLGAGAAT